MIDFLLVVTFRVSSLLKENSVPNFFSILSTGCRDETKFYGQIFKMRTHVMAKTWEFSPSGAQQPTVLWEKGRSVKDSRRKLVGNYFIVYNLTQLDSGQYTLNDRNQVLYYSDLEVVGELTV